MLPLFRRTPPKPSLPPVGAKALFFGESTFEFGVVQSNLCARFGWQDMNRNDYGMFLPSTYSGGTFTLTVSVNGGATQTTATIAPGASAATVQSALAALSNIGSGNVLVTTGGLATVASPFTVSGSTYTITPIGTLYNAQFAITINGGSLTPATVFSQAWMFTIPANTTAGTYTITFNPGTPATSAAIGYNSVGNNGAVNDVTHLMAAMSNVGSGNVRVIGGGTPGTPFVVIFQGTLANNQPAPTINGSGLTPTSTPVATAQCIFTASEPPMRAAVGSTTLQTHAVWSSTDFRPNTTGAADYVKRATQFNPDIVLVWYVANEWINSTTTAAGNPITAARFASALDTVLPAFNALASPPVVVVVGSQPLTGTITAGTPDWATSPLNALDQYDQTLRAKAAQYGATYVYLRDMPARLMQGDGIHPTNPEGLTWVADRIAAAF